ncbi:MAG: hypothetical protein EPN69_04940 [Rhodanobacter sp.]|nr:MAG: hypothetical protein EPN69_04940 [Rhodanobacter sp.]TAM41804.1 MAG: hypothetical protein EPN58_05410 [Rhodanobacter sp.]TAN23254.1 MAG: hypothetical protein EPN32_12260 [Rhodanobacter sp.]
MLTMIEGLPDHVIGITLDADAGILAPGPVADKALGENDFEAVGKRSATISRPMNGFAAS